MTTALRMSRAPMLPDQRRHSILQHIEKEGFVSTQRLVEQLGASESTLRRDLELLEESGQIRRTRGGAAFVGDSLSGLDERYHQAGPEKMSIGKTAAALVEPGEAVLLDGGTTTLEVARNLLGKSLQVVTNSIPIVQLLSTQPQMEVLLIGGYVYPKTGVALGSMAISALSQIHVRRLFISVSGITEKGLFNNNSLLVETERAMLDAAEEVIVVADSSKLGHAALTHLCSLELVDRIVVDAAITPQWQATLEAAGITVTIAPSGN